MKKTGNVRSTIKPEPIVIDNYSVYINENIREVEISDFDDTNHTEYEFEQTIYSKDEYIALLHKSYQEQAEQINDTQLALCELYEASLQV